MLRILSYVSFLVCCLPIGMGEEFPMRLRLKDGSFSQGKLTPAKTFNRLGWHSAGFAQPFQLDLQAVRSISIMEELAPSMEPNLHRQRIELSDGQVIVGKLLYLDDTQVQVDNALLGRLDLQRRQVLSVSDASYSGPIVYAGPEDDGNWRVLSQAADWRFTERGLSSESQQAVVLGKIGLPPKAQINVSLSWNGVPDFVFSFGTSADAPVSEGSSSFPAAARMEVWDKHLAIVREVPGDADIALVTDLAHSNPQVELSIYIDREAGTVTVCDLHGRVLERITAKSSTSVGGTDVHLVNHGSSLTLEKLEVRQWDGRTGESAEQSSMVTQSGESFQAVLIGVDRDGMATYLDSERKRKKIPLIQLRQADVARLPKEASQRPTASQGTKPSAPESAAPKSAAPESTKNSGADLPPPVQQPRALRVADGAAPRVPGTQASLADEFADLFGDVPPEDAESTSRQASQSEQIEVVLRDRSRLRGLWLPAKGGSLRMRARGVMPASGSLDVQFFPRDVLGVIGTTDRYTSPPLVGKRGTLKTEQCQLVGCLADSPLDSKQALFWQPASSDNSSFILESTSGAVIYRKELPRVTKNSEVSSGTNATLAPGLRVLLGGLRQPVVSPGLIAPATTSPQHNTGIEAREIQFRTGDVIDGAVTRIDEEGMHFDSSQTSTTFAKHALVQSIWLNPLERRQALAADKLERLMTVPRSMKSDPPTHLFRAVNGDYLRGRLVLLDREHLTVEVRLEHLQIPREKVAQIIWLHDRKWEKNEPDPDSSNGDAESKKSEEKKFADFRVHGVRLGERGLTFRPQDFKAGILSGSSDLLGECSISVRRINQLLFGRNVDERIRASRDDPWLLSLAQAPRVFQQNGSSSNGGQGSQSPLVGKQAPTFGLETIDGSHFRLSGGNGQVVVLDFWASWCGPCVKTMPLVDQMVREEGHDQVQLVAVNIQESAQRVRAAAERLGLKATVVLDSDGQVAAAYQASAIPMTVIIDREGTVVHVFVGGGARFVQDFRAALKSVVDTSPR